MDTTTHSWSVLDLSQKFLTIEFPEYQREPNIWSRRDKQRLIDSIVRNFDISSFYFYAREKDRFECVDGRQRLNAIMSFLGKNPEDRDDNNFAFQTMNEIYPEERNRFEPLSKHTFEEIEQLASEGHAVATDTVALILGYRLNFVLLSDVEREEEFNLQFTRLNVGLTINAGEKLHAMVGEMRDLCFADGSELGGHAFLDLAKIPTRRYARETVAAQILAQVFSLKASGGELFARTRHYDLQRFLKEHVQLDAEENELVREVVSTLDALGRSLENSMELLRSRALVVSTVVLAWRLRLWDKPQELSKYSKFVYALLCRLKWQIAKGVEMDEEYYYLDGFQRHVTQASVERYAVQARDERMAEEFERWQREGRLLGDAEWQSNHGVDPDEECRASLR